MSNPIPIVSIIREDVETANDCPFGIIYPDGIAKITNESKLSRKKWKERQREKLRAFLSSKKGTV